MDRTVGLALVVFIALAVVGIFFVASPTTLVTAQGDVDAIRAIGTALFGAGLTSFLVEVYESTRVHVPG